MGKYQIIDMSKMPNTLQGMSAIEIIQLIEKAFLSEKESDAKFDDIYDKGFKDGMQGMSIIHQLQQPRT